MPWPQHGIEQIIMAMQSGARKNALTTARVVSAARSRCPGRADNSVCMLLNMALT